MRYYAMYMIMLVLHGFKSEDDVQGYAQIAEMIP
jgi:hypothetical protein